MTKSYRYNKKNKKGGKYTKSNRKNTNKYLKKSSIYLDNSKKAYIIKMFLEMIHMIKLYHWKTYSYSEHKATDELHGRLQEHTDKFVEVLLGKDQSRLEMITDKMELFDYSNIKNFKDHIFKYREFLIDMNHYFDSGRDSDLLNIRDEILGDLNQFLYLLSLK
jgi:hypothetical protein